MPAASMKQLLESGVHFGHQTRRWNPKMKPYIFTERGGIHIIDLQQTTDLLDRAYDFVRNITSRGGTVLFVGTKKQCQDAVAEEAKRVGMPYVSHRWLGGLLTNFATIDNRIKRMHELRKLKDEDQLSLLPTKERMAMERELDKLEVNLGGVSTMTRLPDAVFVADPKREAIATKEVNKLGLPLIGLCDTNCDPDEVEYVIPGNDDAIRSCSLIVKTLVRAVEEGRAKIQVTEFHASEAGTPVQASMGAVQGAGQGSGEPSTSRVGSPRAPRVTGASRGEDRPRSQRPGAQGRSAGGGRATGASRPSEGSRRVVGSENAARRVPASRSTPVKAVRESASAAEASAATEKSALAEQSVTEVSTGEAGAERDSEN